MDKINLKNFLEIPYTQLEEMNLQAKKRRTNNGDEEVVKIFYLDYLKKEVRLKAVTIGFSDLEGRFHMIDYDKKYFLKSYDSLTFDGSSIRGFSRQAESDLRLLIDWKAFWWLPSDVFGPGKVLIMGRINDRFNKPYPMDSRGLLKTYLEGLYKKFKYTVYTANEVEGFLVKGIDAEQTFDEKKGLEVVSRGGYYHSLPNDVFRNFIDRQDLVKKSVNEARLKISNFKFQISKIIILVSDHWHEGIIGLIASKIAEEFYRPTLVLTKSNGNYKGSARSISGFDITKFLRSLKKYLIDIGGHPQAAGFTIETKNLSIFTTTVDKIANKLIKDKDLERKIKVDLKIPLSKINISLVKSLEQLAPFGMGNPKPTFYSEGVLTGAQLFGKTNNHLKIFVSNYTLFPKPYTLELLAFNQADKFKDLSRGKKINIIYNLEIDKWNGREKLRGVVKIIS